MFESSLVDQNAGVRIAILKMMCCLGGGIFYSCLISYLLWWEEKLPHMGHSTVYSHVKSREIV